MLLSCRVAIQGNVMRRLAVAAATLVALSGLAACKKEEAPEGPKSADQVAQASAGPPRPLPGLYRSEVQMISMEAPGMPPQMAEQMKRSLAARRSTNEFCLTPAQAEKGYEERVKKLAGRPDCAFDRYSAAGGKLDAQLTCKADGGMTSVMTMQGMMSPSGSDVTLGMTQSGGQMPGGSMTMQMHVKSERIGDCKG